MNTPDWELLYKREKQLRYRDRRYANAEHQRRLANVVAQYEKQIAELRGERDTIQAAYRDLLAIVNTVHRQDRTYRKAIEVTPVDDTLDLSSLSDRARLEWLEENAPELFKKKRVKA